MSGFITCLVMITINIKVINNMNNSYKVLIMMSIFLVLYGINKYINFKYNPQKVYEFKIDLDEDADEEVAKRIIKKMKDLIENTNDKKK